MGKLDIVNAKEEFLKITKDYKVIAANISFGDSWTVEEDRFKLKPLYTKKDYENFLHFLDREYDSGYGGQKLFGVIYCEDGVWIDRGEYDGSEWYNVHKYPSLRESFDEVDVIKYERNKKLKRINNI
jgi:hypothetical protein